MMYLIKKSEKDEEKFGEEFLWKLNRSVEES